jgi:iron complex outermembrane recepter protein
MSEISQKMWFFKSRMCLSASLAVIAAMSGGASADESNAEAKSAAKIETVVVTGTATDGYRVTKFDMGPLGSKTALDLPYSVQTVSRDLIRNMSVDENWELLKYLPSTQIEYRGGSEVGRPQSRGFEADLLGNTRIDGFAVQSHIPQPVEMTDHVDVFQGLSGALYGPMNPAGVFNYVLKRPTDETRIEVGGEYRSDANGTARADVGGRIGKEYSFGYRANAAYTDGATYVDGSNLHREVEGVALDARLPFGTLIEINAAQYIYDRAGYPGSFSIATGSAARIPNAGDIDPSASGYGYAWAGVRTNIKYYEVRATQSFGSDWNVSGGFLWQNVTRVMRSVGNALNTDGTKYRQTGSEAFSHWGTLANQLYLNGKFSLFGIRNEITVGTNGYVNPGYAANNTAATSTATGAASVYCSAIDAVACSLKEPSWKGPGVFYKTGIGSRYQTLIFGDTVSFDDQWSLTGVYSNGWIRKGNTNAKTVTDLDDATSYTVGLAYKPTKEMTIYANYASSVNPDPGQAPSTASNAYEFLDPFESTQWEAGVKAILYGMDVNLALFRIERPTAWTGTDKIYKVQGQQRNIGVELMAKGKPTDDITVFGGFTWLDTKVSGTDTAATDGKPAVGVPEWQANLLTEYRLPGWLKGATASLNVHYTGEKSANTYNTATADGYATVDLGLRYTGDLPELALSSKYTIRLAVNNLLDKRYWASLMPGSIDGSGTTSGSTAFVGEPRTVKLTLSLGM